MSKPEKTRKKAADLTEPIISLHRSGAIPTLIEMADSVRVEKEQRAQLDMLRARYMAWKRRRTAGGI